MHPDVSSFLSLHPYARLHGRLSSGEMTVHSNQWPMLLFANEEYDPDDPWEGLFRNQLLVWVDTLLLFSCPKLIGVYAGF